MCSRRTLTTLWLGAAAGTLIGMLFAQRKGSELRKQLEKSKHPLQDIILEIIDLKVSVMEYVKKRLDQKKK